MTATPVESEILRARQIVHARIASERMNPWQPEEDTGLFRRTGTLQVEVLEVLKGQVAAAPGDTVEVDITERGTGSPRVMDYYGIWAEVSTSPGTELVAFCDGSSGDLQAVLTDEHCEHLMSAESALEDVRLAMRLEKRRLTTDEVLAEAARVRSTSGELFARYVWARTRNAVVGSTDRFDALLRIAEDPGTRTAARETYLTAAYEDATFTEEAGTQQRARLARSMFRAALDPGTGELRDVLLTAFIPNLVEVGTPERMTAGLVFGDEPDLEARVLADADDARTSAYPGALRTWLTGTGEA